MSKLSDKFVKFSTTYASQAASAYSAFVSTNLSGGSISTAIKLVNTNYNVSTADQTICVSGNCIINLPLASLAVGDVYTIKKIDGVGTFTTIDASGSNLIDGAPVRILTEQNDKVTLQSDGSNWWVIESTSLVNTCYLQDFYTNRKYKFVALNNEFYLHEMNYDDTSVPANVLGIKINSETTTATYYIRVVNKNIELEEIDYTPNIPNPTVSDFENGCLYSLHVSASNLYLKQEYFTPVDTVYQDVSSLKKYLIIVEDSALKIVETDDACVVSSSTSASFKTLKDLYNGKKYSLSISGGNLLTIETTGTGDYKPFYKVRDYKNNLDYNLIIENGILGIVEAYNLSLDEMFLRLNDMDTYQITQDGRLSSLESTDSYLNSYISNVNSNLTNSINSVNTSLTNSINDINTIVHPSSNSITVKSLAVSSSTTVGTKIIFGDYIESPSYLSTNGFSYNWFKSSRNADTSLGTEICHHVIGVNNPTGSNNGVYNFLSEVNITPSTSTAGFNIALLGNASHNGIGNATQLTGGNFTSTNSSVAVSAQNVSTQYGANIGSYVTGTGASVNVFGSSSFASVLSSATNATPANRLIGSRASVNINGVGNVIPYTSGIQSYNLISTSNNVRSTNGYGIFVGYDIGIGTASVAVGKAPTYGGIGGYDNAYGIAVAAVSGDTNAYGLYLGTVSGPNRHSIYAADTSAPSYFGSRVRVGLPTSIYNYNFQVKDDILVGNYNYLDWNNAFVGVRLAADISGNQEPAIDFRRWAGSGTNHYANSIVSRWNGDLSFMGDNKTTNVQATTENMVLTQSGVLLVNGAVNDWSSNKLIVNGNVKAPYYTISNAPAYTGMYYDTSGSGYIKFAINGQVQFGIRSDSVFEMTGSSLSIIPRTTNTGASLYLYASSSIGAISYNSIGASPDGDIGIYPNSGRSVIIPYNTLKTANGSESLPMIARYDEPSTGIYYGASANISFSSTGAKLFDIDSTSLNVYRRSTPSQYIKLLVDSSAANITSTGTDLVLGGQISCVSATNNVLVGTRTDNTIDKLQIVGSTLHTKTTSADIDSYVSKSILTYATSGGVVVQSATQSQIDADKFSNALLSASNNVLNLTGVFASNSICTPVKSNIVINSTSVTANSTFGYYASIAASSSAVSGTVGSWTGYFASVGGANINYRFLTGVQIAATLGVRGSLGSTVIGIQSAIASAAGKTVWNFYSNGSANNCFVGNTLFGSQTPSTAQEKVQVTGDIAVVSIGNGLKIATGSNARIGQATLAAGTITVSNTTVTANTRIFVTVSTAGGTQGFLRTTKVAGTSFTVTSTSNTETSVIDWLLVESI